MLDQNHRPRKRKARKAPSPLHVIGVGSRISVRDLGTGELDMYTLALPTDADISRHWISTFTPLGRAVVGHQAGDLVEFEAPGGRVKIRIESARAEPLADATGKPS